MVVRIDVDACIGCGVCSQLCPEIFKLDEDEGKAVVISQAACEALKEAVDSCPVYAISCESK